MVVRDGCIRRKRVGSLVGGMNILDIQSVALFSLLGVRRTKKVKDCRRDLQRTTMGLLEDSINCEISSSKVTTEGVNSIINFVGFPLEGIPVGS